MQEVLREDNSLAGLGKHLPIQFRKARLTTLAFVEIDDDREKTLDVVRDFHGLVLMVGKVIVLGVLEELAGIAMDPVVLPAEYFMRAVGADQILQPGNIQMGRLDFAGAEIRLFP